MIKNSLALFLAVGLLLFGSRIAVTQSQTDLEAIRNELESIKKNQESLQREIESLKRAMRGGQRPADTFQPTVVDVGNDPYKGELTAKLTLIDFSDYQ